MKKIKIITLVSVAVIAITALVIISCNKENKNIDNKKSLQIENIDEISSEMANFHTFAMKKFLSEIYSEKDILDNNSVEKMVMISLH
jgi:hypothetical protein